MIPLIALAPLALVVVGIAILWVQSRMRTRQATDPGFAMALLASAGWVLFLLGLFAVVLVTTNVFSILTLPATAVALLAMFDRYRVTERRSLIWALTVAAERGIPLESAARAFAAERYDDLGRRARDLADYLEAGVPLGLALARSRNSFPSAVRLAAELGQQTGDLGPALRQASARAMNRMPCCARLLRRRPTFPSW